MIGVVRQSRGFHPKNDSGFVQIQRSEMKQMRIAFRLGEDTLSVAERLAGATQHSLPPV